MNANPDTIGNPLTDDDIMQFFLASTNYGDAMVSLDDRELFGLVDMAIEGTAPAPIQRSTSSTAPTSSQPFPYPYAFAVPTSQSTPQTQSQPDETDFTGGADEEDIFEKRAKRLARNRESAKQSRKRKKMYVELLEDKVKNLSTEIQNLKKHQFTNEKLYESERKFHGTLEDMLRNNTDEEAVGQVINQIQDALGSNGAERHAAIQYYFEQLQSLLVPGYSKFLMWSLNQDDKFFQSDSTQPDVWSKIAKAVGVSPEQQTSLLEYRSIIKEEKQQLAVCLQYLQKLTQNIIDRSLKVDENIQAMRRLFRPSQIARFLLWLHHNWSLVQQPVENLLSADERGAKFQKLDNNTDSKLKAEPLPSPRDPPR
eukprot:GILK01006548.1.p1 GENE.GILK01006548.1~~GILK01006548.1.p1  ORF type:complete len:368 (-),score=83.23 GILK01006548.1:247-1350(-)